MLPNPLQHHPHPLALQASQQLMQRLQQHTELSKSLFLRANGKMFGVLVVRDACGKYGFLSAFSGQLNQQWLLAGFVPPVFDIEQRQHLLAAGEARLAQMTHQIEQLAGSPARAASLQQRLDLEQQQAKAQQALKARHQHNRLERQAARVAAQLNEPRLQQLSLLSQHDKREWKQCKQFWDDKISLAQQAFERAFEQPINTLMEQRKSLSRSLHHQVFDQYHLHSFGGETSTMQALFGERAPPGGAGDCAAPKLLQYAQRHYLIPVALAEFWWGAEPLTEVRHHGNFYPPCRGKCEVILPFMLQGLKLKQRFEDVPDNAPEPELVYEDASLLVLNKPAGMLSIPGKQARDSVLGWLQRRYPQATGPLLVHRLDMATSGLLLVAKTGAVHKHLQRQFIRRTIKKRYVAILSRALDQQECRIELPLRVDLDDRPRQMVCYQHGRQAITDVRVIATDGHTSRVYFYPLTGRTHQLRVHAAHALGLAAPIVGDALYGTQQQRLMLHAERISFEHPLTAERIELACAVPF